MAAPNVFKYNNYRLFMADWLKDRGFSYRSFAERYSSFVSMIALAKLLSKGRSGGEPKANYNMAPESVARLGKAMGLPAEELRQLILLRLENDAETLPGQHGSAYKRELKRLMEENRMQVAEAAGKRPAESPKEGSETAVLLYEFFELLPSRNRARALEEIIMQGRVYAGRQAGKPGVRKLQSLLERLNHLMEMGAP